MAYEYQYGDDDQIDYYLRRIERVQPGYYNNFVGPGGTRKRPSDAEITNYYYKLSAEGAFYWVNDDEQERLIRKDKEERRSYNQSRSDNDVGFWGALGGLIGLVGGLMFEDNPEFYEEDEDQYYYEDEDDY